MSVNGVTGTCEAQGTGCRPRGANYPSGNLAWLPELVQCSKHLGTHIEAVDNKYLHLECVVFVVWGVWTADQLVRSGQEVS